MLITVTLGYIIYHRHFSFCLAFDRSNLSGKILQRRELTLLVTKIQWKEKMLSEQDILAMHKTLAHQGTLQTPKQDLNSGRLNSIVYTLNHPQRTAGPLYISIQPKLEQIGESLGRLVKTQCSPPLEILEVRQFAFLKSFQVALILPILPLLLKGLKLACWLSLKQEKLY